MRHVLSLFAEKEPLCNLKVDVIGLGNIGSKVALRLVEAGAQTSIFTRDYDSTLKLSSYINKLKPKSTITSPIPFRRFLTCATNQNYIFICTGSDLKISRQIANNISENTKLFT